ncbi:MAG TPA: S1-like domain-containing RNA-binding protein [Cytophagaceae bacterium]|nr:S1-like domain-containing RNA-binding protein [Cytophagaceae bacterium]
MLQIGDYNELKVVRDAPQGIYLESVDVDILMPAKYVPAGTEIGDMLKCFIYKDSEDRLIATTLKPYGKVGDFACLKVKDVNNTGAFMDWGLEKDLLVPHNEQHKRMEPGHKYVVRICLDEKSDRIIGVSRLSPFISRDLEDLSEGEKVNLLIYEFTDLGVMAIVNDKFRGMLYRNEVFKDLEVGSKVEGYIKKKRDDGKIDLTLQEQGYREVVSASRIIEDKLKEHKGILEFSDNSSPEDIRDFFHMSKKVFKKAVGGLYREGKIEISDNQIRLKDKNKE